MLFKQGVKQVKKEQLGAIVNKFIPGLDLEELRQSQSTFFFLISTL